MSIIERLTGLQILDSRGRPTVQATCVLESGASATASVPSGASTGTAEAHELRDGDRTYYRGLGCRKAVSHISEEINRAFAKRSFEGQTDFDNALRELDGTSAKSRLGANAILAVSIAFARAQAGEKEVPLYLHFADILGQPLKRLPRLTVNLFSGGKHAGGQVPIQDVLVVPASARTIDEALAMVYEVYQCAAELTYRKYGMRALTADEGGLAPSFPNAEALLEDAVDSIFAAGLRPGPDVALAVDVASTHFYKDGYYDFQGKRFDSTQMIEQLLEWLERYPIASIEDGLFEDDWNYWPELLRRADKRARIVGDDLLCTNPDRIRRAIDAQAADTLLVKVNQIGTLTEAAESCRLAHTAGWHITVSARSGETEDNWLADLAVGWSGHQIKVGSMTQSERLSKYNRLLAIEAETNLPITDWPEVS